MRRKFTEILKNWEQNQIKKPMLVIGARQTGKTWIINQFCRETYTDYLYLNLEEHPEYIVPFEKSSDPSFIIRQLEIICGHPIKETTTIFIDEIQKSEKAINSLKYFCESPVNFRIIGAGSLLGVKLARYESSFPVGKVDIHYLYPMDYEEFLWACGEETLAGEIEKNLNNMSAMLEPVHVKADRYYQDYLYIGGMPEAVNNYIENGKDPLKFNRTILQNIILAYKADMSKYTSNGMETVKIGRTYDSVPSQLAKPNPKFQYKIIRSGANSRDYSSSLDWLNASEMILTCYNVKQPLSPLKAYEVENDFKVYLSDPGLLCTMSGLHYADLNENNENIFKGAVTENYIVCTFKIRNNAQFFYKSGQFMEIDYLLDTENGIYPMEIKAGRHKRSTSLKKYADSFHPEKMYRFSRNNFDKIGNLYSLPLYAACWLKKELLL